MEPTLLAASLNAGANSTCLIILLIALAVIIIGRFLLKLLMWIILIIIVLVFLGVAGYFFKEIFGLIIFSPSLIGAF